MNMMVLATRRVLYVDAKISLPQKLKSEKPRAFHDSSNYFLLFSTFITPANFINNTTTITTQNNTESCYKEIAQKLKHLKIKYRWRRCHNKVENGRRRRAVVYTLQTVLHVSDYIFVGYFNLRIYILNLGTKLGASKRKWSSQQATFCVKTFSCLDKLIDGHETYHQETSKNR